MKPLATRNLQFFQVQIQVQIPTELSVATNQEHDHIWVA